MTRFQVDADAVFHASSAIRSTISRIQSEVGGLHSSWSGQAATAFQSVVTQWQATQQRVEENLAAINQALNQAGQHYTEIEAQNARLFGQ